MSVQATTAVWEHSRTKGPDLIMLLAIADAANADGWNAHPGPPRLMKHTRTSARTSVSRRIGSLIDRAELVRTQEPHRGQLATYAIVLPGLEPWVQVMDAVEALIVGLMGARAVTLSDEERVAPGDRKGRGFDPNGSRSGPSTPLVRTKEPENQSTRASFVAFWERYPKRHGKKIGKRQTEARWLKLSSDEQALVLRAVEHYADACDRGLTLAKDPERFLRSRVWEDWQEPAEPSRNGNGRAPAQANDAWAGER